MQKMPLGKLSKKQIQSAYEVLSEAQRELEGNKDHMKLLDCSNRFFTLIPHDFGMKKPPLLDNEAFIKVSTHCLCFYYCIRVVHFVYYSFIVYMFTFHLYVLFTSLFTTHLLYTCLLFHLYVLLTSLFTTHLLYTCLLFICTCCSLLCLLLIYCILVYFSSVRVVDFFVYYSFIVYLFTFHL